VADSFLQAEGFTGVKYHMAEDRPPLHVLAAGQGDFALDAARSIIASLDAGLPLVVLGGIHLGCYELFGTKNVRSIRDLKGKTVSVYAMGSDQHIFLASMAAYVGLDPEKDIKWIVRSSEESIRLLAEGEIDAHLAFPPEPQELRAKGIGHVIVNTATDKPWSQYFCCMLVGNRDFVRKHPAATKRALRAMLKATDLCASDPEGAARLVVDKGYSKHYRYTMEALTEVPYNAWRTYDHESTMRFFALRLREARMIKANPEKIITEGTDWRFLAELRKELKG
jgi:NitT/TauT family transport system substrate-binding protein